MLNEVDADVTLRQLAKGVNVDSIEGSITADLGPSKVGQAAIDRAYVSGDYRHALADIYQLDVSGSDVRATGHGTIAFNETDQSGFWLHADAAHLESINAALNSQQSLTGIGTLDVVVGGNKKEFTVNGTVTGNGVRYGDYGALAASSKFNAKIPNLDAQQTTVTADTSATFVDIAGQEINELTAKTDYRDKNVDFTLNAGETPEQCARREVTEEAGVVAGKLDYAGFIFPAPGYTDEKIHIFLARDLTQQELEAITGGFFTSPRHDVTTTFCTLASDGDDD